MPRSSRFTFASRRSLLIVIFIAVLGWIVASVSASIGSFTPVFKTVPTFTVAANPQAAPYFIVSGDFNKDGRPDVITATDASNGTWISLNLGNGNFSPSVLVGGSATHMATADFNNDGKLDLTTVLDTGPTTTASVYLGNGAGGFSLSTNVTVGSRPQSVVTADFNGDNKIDLATVNFASNNIAVAFGNGAGGFSPVTTFATGAAPRGLAVGDFNGDNKPDLVTSSENVGESGSIQVLLNNGSGSFGSPINTERPGSALYISVADFNHDNKADVAISLNNGNSISVRLGNGSGGFNGFNGSNDYPIISQPSNISIGDFNSDGELDLATANRTVSNEISLLFGDGAGNFGQTKHLTIGPSPWSVTANDFNSDGKLDLAVALRGNNTFTVLRGDGAGNFPDLLPNFAVGTNPVALAAGDLNGDGKTDLVTANQASNNISILTNDGRGTFSAPVNLAAGTSPRGVATGDVNNDGRTDIVIGRSSGGPNLSVLLNDGAGNFTPAPNSPYLVAGDPRTIAFGDLNGDGLPDIVTGAFNGDRFSVLFNIGANGFGNYTEYVLSPSIFYQVTGLVVADFNQDNLPDVALVGTASQGNRLFVYFNLGGGTGNLGNRAIYSSVGSSLVAGDFNRDGLLDLLSGSAMLLATGGGNFTAPFNSGGFGAVVADFNNDGKLDGAVITLPDQVRVYKGNGDGTFNSSPVSYRVSNSPTALVAADLNDDTKPDIGVAVASQSINAVTRLLNVVNKTPADFDDDGRTDISVWNPNNGNWYIFNSRDNSFRTQVDWGRQALGDIPVPGDYDGDAKQDIAIFRPSEGNWYIINSDFPSIRIQNWGGPNDRPAPADFDGDGKTDFAVFRPSEGNWYILFSATGTTRVQGWGLGTDKLVPGDYDGDGKADIAIWRPTEGNWYILKSNGGVIQQQWGIAGDIPVPGDYDGDSKTDMAVFRPSDGNWYVINSATNTPSLRNWGNATDVPVPGDYDRDGKTDFAIYRPSEGNWFIIRSSTNTAYFQTLGVGNEVPIPSTYIPFP